MKFAGRRRKFSIHARLLQTCARWTSSGRSAARGGDEENHRAGLYDMILIKDNHIDFAGSITEAVRRARSSNSALTIEVEARNLADVAEALDAGVEWIMLDNMELDEMRQAVVLNAG